MSTIAVIGDALVDVVDGQRLPGGAALNVAVGAARLGAAVTLVAMVGDDADGALLRSYCESHGVRLIATEAPHGTAVAVATRSGGSMDYVFNEAARERLVQLEGDAAAAVDAADLVVVSCVAFEKKAQASVVAQIRDPQARLVLDANPRPGYLPEQADREAFRNALEPLAVTARLVKVGDEDAELLWGLDAHLVAAGAVAVGAGAALVTEGAKGAAVHTPTARLSAPIACLDSPIVSTIGAGDSVIATVAVRLADGDVTDDAWPALLERAMLVAAATCRVASGELQLP